jgi:hypothetical protein
LVTTSKIYSDFLAVDGWQIKGERRVFGHSGCGGGQRVQLIGKISDSVDDSRLSCDFSRKNHRFVNNPG